MASAPEEFGNGSDGSKIVEAMSKFAWDLYGQLTTRDAESNVFLSPASISIALAMTYLGTGGSTKEEMKNALNLNIIDESKVHPSYEHIIKTLQNTGGSYQLSMANRLFDKEGFDIIEAFLIASKKHYGSELQSLNFGADPEGSAKVINDWVEGQTNKKIKDLIPSSALGPLTALVLINAIYFKGNWALPFDAKHTREMDFEVKGKETVVKIPMMVQQNSVNLGYNRDLEAQVLEMPYIDEKLSMFILLPQKHEGLDALEGKLSINHLININNLYQMRKTRAQIFVPRFKLEDSFDLETTLPLIGLKELFDEQKANLSGIDARNNLYVSKVVHKAFIEVNEEGSEAAAATGVIANVRSLPPQFRCNHPFLFFIKENDTGIILFIGKLKNPVP